MTRVIAVAAALLALAVAAPAAHAVPGYEFADWIAADNGPVTGSLHGRAISFNGVTQTNANVYDGTYTKFDSDLFTPPLPATDVVQMQALHGRDFVIDLGGPVTNPILHLYTLASTITFPTGTVVTKLSGEDTFTVSANTVSGQLSGGQDSSGTVQLSGTFSQIFYSAEPNFDNGNTVDGVGVQVGIPIAAPTTDISVFGPTKVNDGYPGNAGFRVRPAGDSTGGALETRCVLDPPSAPASFDDLPPSCPYVDATTTHVPGVHTVYAASRDYTGAKQPVASATFRVLAVPDTTITGGPPADTWDPNVQFTFASDLAGSSFKCRLDSGDYVPCASPYAPRLAPGNHTFYVRAVSPDGVVDPTPAQWTFTLRGPESHDLSCEVKPVYFFPYTLTTQADHIGCAQGFPGSVCNTAVTCIQQPLMLCPAGLACTVTTTARWFDADRLIDYHVEADTAGGESAECSTGLDGDRCTAIATGTVIGPHRMQAGCQVLLIRGTAVPGASETGDDFVRRIECGIDLHIERAPPLVPFVGGSDVSLVAPSAGTLGMTGRIGGVRLKVAAAGRKKRRPRPAIATVKKTVASAGPVSLPLKLNAPAKKLLKRKKKLSVTLITKFTPAGGGKPTTTRKRVVIRQPRKPPKSCKNRHSRACVTAGR